MTRDISGPVSISLLACWVSFFLFRLPRGKYDNIEIQFVEEVALEREVEGDLFLQDIGQGFGFRPGSFDGAIRYPSHQCPQMSI